MNNQEIHIEKKCTIEFEGRTFENGGAVVTSEYIVAYPKENGILGDWRGKPIGTYRITASWPIRSRMRLLMNQIEACVKGVRYTGRGFGVGMIYKGKRIVQQ